MKNLMNLKNAKVLSKKEQKSINGAQDGPLKCTNMCNTNSDCGPMMECFVGPCLGYDTRMCRAAGSVGIQ